MRTVLIVIALLSQAAHSLEGCPDARWTKNSAMYTDGCSGLKCMTREIRGKNGERCARVVYTIEPEKGGFSSEIFDAHGKLRNKEFFYVDPADERPYIRTDVMNADGRVMYYLDKDEVARLPDGSELADESPNPAGEFYEQVVSTPFPEDP